MRKYITIALLALLALSMLPLGGCAHPSPGVLTLPGEDWGYPSPFTFYPRGPGYLRMSLIFDTLVWKDESGFIPWLADSWQRSKDGKTWTFNLHHGVEWHDGQPFSAEDVKFSFDYIGQQVTTLRWFSTLSYVESVDVEGDHTVVINLNTPFAPFLEQIAGNLPMIPKHIWENVTDPLRYTEPEAVIGTGPFKLDEYSKAEGVYVYEANDRFSKGKPIIEQLLFTMVSDEALALKTKTTDAASFWGKEIDAVNELEADPDLEVITGPSFWILQLVFNCQKYPTDISDFRKAVAYATDRTQIVEVVTHGGAIEASPGVIHPESDWWNPDLPSYEHSKAMAEQLLDSLNMVDDDGDGVRETPHGDELSFTLATTAEFTREAEIIRADLEDVGIDIVVQAVDWSTLDAILREGNFNLAISGHGGIGDPATLEYISWPTTTYSTPEYDALFVQQQQTLDEAQRKALVFELQEIVANDLPVYGLYHPLIWCVFNPEKLDTYFYTKNGVASGIPSELNKLIFIRR